MSDSADFEGNAVRDVIAIIRSVLGDARGYFMTYQFEIEAYWIGIALMLPFASIVAVFFGGVIRAMYRDIGLKNSAIVLGGIAAFVVACFCFSYGVAVLQEDAAARRAQPQIEWKGGSER